MAFHIQDDFKPGRPITQVPAGWFNSVARFLNNLIPGRGIKFEKNFVGPTIIELSPDDPASVGTPVSVGEFPDDEVTQHASSLWRAGGKNGASLLVLYKDDTDSNVGTHKLYAARLTISSDGRIVSIDAASNIGIEIGA